jgi:hypothetical protein
MALNAADTVARMFLQRYCSAWEKAYALFAPLAEHEETPTAVFDYKHLSAGKHTCTTTAHDASLSSHAAKHVTYGIVLLLNYGFGGSCTLVSTYTR